MRFVLFLFLSGCAMWKPTPDPVRRGPVGAAAWSSPGGLNHDEQKICAETECKQLIAPCSVTDQKYHSLKEEAYLRQIEEIPQRGFCQLPARKLPPETYNNDTCLYVFVKQDSCPTH